MGMDELSEFIHESYSEHMRDCAQCRDVPEEQEPVGLCPEGVIVWQRLQDWYNMDED